MADQRTIIEVLKDLGKHLQFEVKKEVGASESAWVDLVWFDNRFPTNGFKSVMRYVPVLPVVGFEIEAHTGLNAKHVKGSVSNLNNLSAQLGVIIIGEANLETLAKQANQKNKSEPPKTADDFRTVLRDRVYRWVYAEAQPRGRIIVMFEKEVRLWEKNIRTNSKADIPIQLDPLADG